VTIMPLYPDTRNDCIPPPPPHNLPPGTGRRSQQKSELTLSWGVSSNTRGKEGAKMKKYTQNLITRSSKGVETVDPPYVKSPIRGGGERGGVIFPPMRLNSPLIKLGKVSRGRIST